MYAIKMQFQEPNGNQLETRAKGNFSRKLIQYLFYLHLILIAILIIFLNIRNLVFYSHNDRDNTWKLYPPLFVSSACAAIVGLTWQWMTSYSPSRSVRATFWLSPMLGCGVGILLVSMGSPGSLASGVVFLVSAIAQSLYSCWVTPRLNYAVRILSVSIASPPNRTVLLSILSITFTTMYSCLLETGLAAATATINKLNTWFILTILLSLFWTMQIIKNILQVTTSRVIYTSLARGIDIDTNLAFRHAVNDSMGSVCIGSLLVPILGVIRGSAKAMSLISGDTDEFLFSCADCYSGVATKLISYGNRWGFVHVGVYNIGFVQASRDVWEKLTSVGLQPLLDCDLTSSFCFLSGVAGGSVSALVCGSWVLVIHKSCSTQATLYAFLIGYYMTRMAMACHQASVSAYYVSYAESPRSQKFDSTIPVRIQELQRSQV